MIGEIVAALVAAGSLTFAYQVYRRAADELRLVLKAHRSEAEDWFVERKELLSLVPAAERVWAEERGEMLDRASAAQDAWAEERRELLNRIQRPDVVHHAPTEGFVMPEPEPDDFEQVGSIHHDPEYEFDSSLADQLTAAVFPNG